MAHRLLLADDSVTIQRVIELTFADEDVEVLTAGDGEQAITRVQAERPDIVLADIGMPKRSGYDVAAFIKGQPELSHIPVLLLTGAFEPVDEGRAQATGCDGVLVKPFEPQNVIARVKELLHGTGANVARTSWTVTRAVSDVPRRAERLAPPRTVEPPARGSTAGRGSSSIPSAPSAPLQAPVLRRRSIDDFDFALSPHDAAAANEASLDDYFDRLDAAFANGTTQAEGAFASQSEASPRREGPVKEKDVEWFDAPALRAASAQQMAPSQPAPPGASVSQGSPSMAVSSSQIPALSAASPVASTEQAAPARVIDARPVTALVIDPVPTMLATPPASFVWAPPRPAPLDPLDNPAETAPQPSHAVHASPEPALKTGSTIADVFSALLAVEQGEPGAAPVRFAMAGSAPVVTEELVDEVSRRVIKRLGAQAVQDVVTDIVSRVAERLICEEIDRIRKGHS